MIRTLLGSPRLLCTCGFLVCAALLGSALYMEHRMGLEPCPLCIFQRVALMATAALFLVTALLGFRKWLVWVFGIPTTIAALSGVALAARHIWLQHLPEDRVPECGPGLDYLIEVFPLKDVLAQVLSGSGECAEVSWTFLGLSIPEWTILAFIGLAALSILAIIAAGKVRSA